MNIFIIGIASLVVLAVIAAITTLLSKHKEGEPDVVMPTSGDCSSCDGMDDKCEQVCMMEAATKEIEYYDDEELVVVLLRTIRMRKPKSLLMYSTPCNLKKQKAGIEALFSVVLMSQTRSKTN